MTEQALWRTRPGADAIRAAPDDEATEVAPGTWLSSGLSNTYLLTHDDGRIVVNTGMGFEAPTHRRNFDAVSTAPVSHVVLTQGHFDHVGGVDVMRDPGSEIVMQADWATWRDDNERLGAFRVRNSAFAWYDAIAGALKPGAPAQAAPTPTLVVDGRLTLDVGGRVLELIATPGGETTDSLVVWLPEEGVCLSGNVFGCLIGHIPNLVTMRGDRYRDALTVIDSIETVRALEPEVLLTGHFEPVVGADLIAEELTRLRDAVRWLHDAVVDGMNAGTDVHTLMATLRPPYDVGEGYGKVAWDVRAIWETYAGWFHHASTTELYAVPARAVHGDLVELAGADAIAARARHRLEAGEPVEAILLAEIASGADPDHVGARAVMLDAHRTLLDASTNFWETAWLRKQISEPVVNSARFDFGGATVLVTGGTSGIGHAVARSFLAAGATVHVTGTRATAADYETDLTGLVFHRLEVTDAAAVTELGASYDVLDVLVNNAGANFPGGRDEWEPDVFEDALAINLSSHQRLTSACRPALRASAAAGGASVVNVVSMSAIRAVPIVPGYGSAKAGLLQLTRNLAVHWAKDGIRVNAIAPGVIDTPMTRPMNAIPELVAEQVAHIPMGRFGTAEEIAGAVLFLCSAQASYVTGTALLVDGGYAAI